MKNIAFTIALIASALSTSSYAQPDLKLCLQEVCINQPISEIPSEYWDDLSDDRRVKGGMKDNVKYLVSAFPEADVDDLRQLSGYFATGNFDANVLEFIANSPAVCAPLGLVGTVTAKDRTTRITIVPDDNDIWRIVGISRQYTDIPSSAHKANLVKALDEYFQQWKPLSSGEYVGPVVFEFHQANVLKYKVSLKHPLAYIPLTYGATERKAFKVWEDYFPHYQKSLDGIKKHSYPIWDDGANGIRQREMYSVKAACGPKADIPI